MIVAVPKIAMPKRANVMRGQPITAEEFERMLAKVPAVSMSVGTPKRQRMHSTLHSNRSAADPPTLQ
jgi:hypothetical protein